MNRTIGIIVAIIIIAAGVWFFVSKKDGTQTKNDTESVQTEAKIESENTSIKALIDAGKDVKCTFKSPEEGSESTGTIYASKGKARGDFSTTTDNMSGSQTINGHMIVDGTTGYFWNDGQTTGMKMTINPEGTQSSSTSSQAVDPNQKYDFKCDSWRADASVFVPPANVTFQELKIPAMPSASTSNSTQMQVDQSAVCNSLPEPAKTQCLASIKKQ